MADDDKRETRRRSVWLPATVLLLMLSLVGGAVYWLTVLPPPGDDTQAEVAKDPTAPQKPGPKDPVPKQVEAAKESAKTPSAPVENTEPGKTKPTGVVSPSNLSKDSQPDPRHEASKKEGRPPTDVADGVAKADMATQPAPPAAKPSTAPAAPDKPDVPPAPAAAPGKPAGNSAVAPPVSQTALALPRAPPAVPLPQAPDPALVENSPKGPLPVVGRDGREAWRVYARPFDQLDKRPRISVVLYGLGTSSAATRTAIQGLPGSITLAFSPYADGLNTWIADARAAGHEILLMVPMEPRNYPDYDPGPQALLTSLTRTENTQRLEWILGRGVGYVGVTDFMGSRFTNSTQHMRALFRNLKNRGLMFLESRVSARAVSSEIAAASKVPFAASALYIDSQASRPAIDGQLAEAERLAKNLGAVVVMGFVYPVTLERVAKWAATVEKRGFSLAPVSATAKRRN